MILAYNLGKLSRFFGIKDRRKALDSTKRLEEFVYNDNHIDGPTPEETEEEQRRADELYFEHSTRYHTFKSYLNKASDVCNPKEMANWLKENLDYRGVNIAGQSAPIPFEAALQLGYAGNIREMFKNEIKRLKKEVKKSSKYIFNTNN